MRFLAVCALGVLVVSGFAAAPTAQSSPHAKALSGAARELFKTSDTCVACHNGLRTAQGEDVSIGTMWGATMMANSARDPYFHASLRRETLDHPSLAREIQDECAGCHLPMLQRAAHAAHQTPDVLSLLPMTHDDDETGRMAADGVSCSVCHQISAEKLGTRASFNGRFSIADAGAVPRPAFGPFNVDPGRARVMQSVTGLTQTEATHVRDSTLCATCHTLYTDAHGPDGSVVGQLPEQMNFLEWKHSAFYEEQRSCQSCHMPALREPAPIAAVLGPVRDGGSRHLFVGGNAFMLRVFERFRDALSVPASPESLARSADATVRQLQTETATLALRVQAEANAVSADVVVESLTGHKFPTGYPSRRSWLHLVARDARGEKLFESGALLPSGAIAGNDNDSDRGRFEPHHERIDDADQVQIYETILLDQRGAVTTGLLQATGYAKDNRLLPRGFVKATATRDIAVVGDAADDENFTGGGDTVRYLLPAATDTVDVELWFQPIAFRWMDNLRAYDAPEPRMFVGYFDRMRDHSAVRLAHVSGRRE